MAINPLYNSSTIRLMGMASGIDTESIIQQTMKIHQLKIDSRFRARTLLEWKQQSLNSIADELTAFRRSYLTVLGANAMRTSSVYNSTIATVSGKNANAVSVTTTINSSTGTIKIGQIASLAQNTYISTTGNASKSGEGFKLTDKLGDIFADVKKLGFTGGEVVVSVKDIDGKSTDITLETSDTAVDLQDKLADIGIEFGALDQIDVNINGRNVSLDITDTSVDVIAKYNSIADQAYTSAGALTFDSNGEKNIRINNVMISLNRNMTIDDMINKVNYSGAGVNLSYDRMADKFTVESSYAGNNALTVWGMEAFGISNGTYQNGSLARVQINGEWIEKDTNTFDFRGARITLNSITAKTGYDPDEDDITVTFKRDATEPLEKIKAFVEAYNTIVSKLETLLKETKNTTERTYTPLTDEEKSLMSEKQIDEWELIAKKGILRNDAGLQTLTNSLRSALFERVEAAGMSPFQIGLSTGLYKDGTGGQIVLDEDKLKAALEKDPEAVMNVFMGGSDSDKSEGRGLLWRMDDLMGGYVGGSQLTSINNLETSIRRANEQMETLQKKMFDEEDKLYKKFAAMETALAKIQSQGDWLTAMLASMNSSNK